MDDQVTKESEESMVTLEPRVHQARPVLHVTLMDRRVLQDLKGPLDRVECQVCTE